MEEINKELNKVYSGEILPQDAHKDIQTFLRIGAYNMAHTVANLQTQLERQEALAVIASSVPFFHAGVELMAKEIFKAKLVGAVKQ